MEVCNISVKRLKKFTKNQNEEVKTFSLNIRFSEIEWIIIGDNENTNINMVKKLPKKHNYKGNPL